MAPRTKHPVYRSAAERVHAGEDTFSCMALYHVMESHGLSDLRTVQRYEDLFAPFPVCNTILWGQAWGRNRRACRTFALLLMQVIDDDERAG